MHVDWHTHVHEEVCRCVPNHVDALADMRRERPVVRGGLLACEQHTLPAWQGPRRVTSCACGSVYASLLCGASAGYLAVAPPVGMGVETKLAEITASVLCRSSRVAVVANHSLCPSGGWTQVRDCGRAQRADMWCTSRHGT